MREENARRKLDKKVDTLARDKENTVGNAKGFHKAVRAYGKALIHSALEDLAEDTDEAMDPCIMCAKPCVSLCCSHECKREAVQLGVIQPERFD